MSISRFGCDGSDIYLYNLVDGDICCQWCTISDGKSFKIKNNSQGIKHLRNHILNGDKVTQYALDYFESGLVSNITKEDIDKPTQKYKIPKVECVVTMTDENGEKISEIGLGAYLNHPKDKIKKIKALFTAMERVVTKKVE